MNRILFSLVILLLFLKCSTKHGQEKMDSEFSEEEYNQHYDLKSQGLARVLGESSDIVGHAIIPFDVGGAVDMYYYPNGIDGTGFATMELIQPDGTGPVPNRNGTYELVAFTKLPYTTDTTSTNPFNIIERRTCGTFTDIGNYSFDAKLEPGETIEIPTEDGTNKCFVLDEYKPGNAEFNIGNQKHGLLLVIEIFRDEMEYAMENGSASLFAKLKSKGYYPYSDLDRQSVLK